MYQGDKLTDLQLLFEVFDAIKTLKFAAGQLDQRSFPLLLDWIAQRGWYEVESLCEAAIRGLMNVPDPRAQELSRSEVAYLEDCAAQAERSSGL